MGSLAALRKLYTKRQLIQSALNEIDAFVKRFGVGGNLHEIKNRINQMPKLRDDYEAVIFGIIELEDVDSIGEFADASDEANKTEINDLTDFQNRWYTVLSDLQAILDKETESKISVKQNEFAPKFEDTSQVKIRLPVINLPEFSGSYKDWLPFFDAFRSLIHENHSISDCQKFHYLKSCLKGEAHRAIESLSISNSNYASAWEILQKRYENERLIIQSHVQSILNTPEIVRSSSESLRKLVDDVTSNIEALKILNVPVDACDSFVVTIVMGKMDYQTRKEFESTLTTEFPSRKEIIEFLSKKSAVLESMSQNSKPKHPLTSNVKRNTNTFNKSTNFTAANLSCHYCKQRHFINQCVKFLALNVLDRKKEVNKLKLCTNCLRNTHITSDCKSMGCKICKNRGHHTLLHEKSSPTMTSERQEAGRSSESTIQNSTNSANYCSQTIEPNVILSTAIVLIKDASGTYKECRALLDMGSQLNILSEKMCNQLKLKTTKTKLSIWGVNETCSNVTSSVELTVKSVYYPFEMNVTAYVSKRVASDIPACSFNRINIPEMLNLADPNYNKCETVDLILNAEVFWSVLGTERIKLLSPNLFLTETLLGWIVGGAYTSEFDESHKICNLSIRKEQSELCDLMEKFWSQEELTDIQDKWSEEEKQCEEHFINTFNRDPIDGRFILQLPFKNDTVELGDSSRGALRRFISLEKRFKKDPEIKEKYVKAIRELLDAGIIEEISSSEPEPELSFYLPHSGVFKKSSSKIRIVFDGSFKTTNGLSLNDVLLTGPNLQLDLFGILLQFRIHCVVISCDIEKMFLQIKIDKNHVNFQRLYWRESENETVKKYRLTRLVFGLSPSPYAAMRCIRQLASDIEEKYPLVSYVLSHEIYMDDILCGVDNTEGGIKLRDQLIEVLNSAQFTPSKWLSNDPRVVPFSDSEGTQSVSLNFEKPEASKILGLWWHPKNDELSYKVTTSIVPEHLTKRIILSSIAKLYDPVGMIAPVIVKAKILMQKLWVLNVGWDDAVPNNVREAWVKYTQELQSLNKIKIPRKVLESKINVELVIFCDASLEAYGAVVYLRNKLNNGKFSVNLLCSKSRLSPIKAVSLPRLELCAALLAARLSKKVEESLNVKICKKYYFSDSLITLHYINSHANSWKVFIANRVAKIQNLTEKSEWNHIKGNNNPADIISRGAYPKQLIDNNLYWNGPSFLTLSESKWPDTRFNPETLNLEIPEKRKVTFVTGQVQKFDILTKFSSFSKLQRVIAYVSRFINNVRHNNRLHGFLSRDELIKAKDTIIKIVQAANFQEEICLLRKGQLVNKQSKLYTLDPFLDSKGIIRVGGRLKEADLPYDHKYPAVLPEKHHVTKLLVNLEHLTLLHAGPSQTLASLRTKYWPLRAKGLVRQVIHSCIKCFRAAPKLIAQKMGNLPKDRLEPCRPFLKIGLDYFGPLFLKLGGKRSRTKSKAWTALFVCLVTKAIHLEIVLDLTSESFINALKRFIARRGKVSHIYCDNATTFVGAKAELNEIRNFLCNDKTQSDIHSYLYSENISWNFIPPRAPNFGGLWERLVRSVKLHIKKVIACALLTYEEAITLFIQIEAIINSRPLLPFNDNPSDFHALTPAHFLIGESLMGLPEYNIHELPDNKLGRWQRVQKLKTFFWKRFSKEVLSVYQQRQKWCQPSHNQFKIGALVLLAEDTPPMVWKMGRIVELFPGTDGIARVASVKTSHGIYKRSLRKLAPLPIMDEEERVVRE